jgi:heat shock protein HslJ
LVELNGKPINGDSATHYIIFHTKEGTIEAKAGCNIIIRQYKIKNELQVKIGEGISTLMACPGGVEDQFLKVLSQIDNLSTDGVTLLLNKAKMAPLGRFELVGK